MQLDHERLDVYDLALEFLVLANGLIEGFPRGRSHLADQFTRASLSIVLNLAEGAGKHSKLDKRRYYVTARGSATESAALLDVCQRLKLLDEAGHRAAKGMLVRIDPWSTPPTQWRADSPECPPNGRLAPARPAGRDARGQSPRHKPGPIKQTGPTTPHGPSGTGTGTGTRERSQFRDTH